MNGPEYIASHVGFPSFFKTPIVRQDEVRDGTVVVAGVPIDMGIVLARPGARYGPRAIREASLFYRAVHEVAAEHTSVNIDTKSPCA